jgi:N-methylhydantoinase A
MRVGIDIGGTFTDIVAVDPDSGHLLVSKRLTTPEDLSRCFLEALQLVNRERPGHEFAVVHGTTVATNALLQGGNHAVGMIATAGFRDVIEIGRHFRRRLYDLFLDKPRPLIPACLRLEVQERKDSMGETVIPLNLEDVRAAARTFQKCGVGSVCICFINAYADGRHEQAARRIVLEETPGVYVSISSEVSPEYREFERFSTTAVNAIVMPVVDDYLRRLNSRCAAEGVNARIAIMQSNGGMMSPEEARRFPVRLIESGPAAGVLAARHIGSLCGEDNVIAFDMGGTTAKVGLIREGEIQMKTEYRVGGGIHGDDTEGYPIKTPAIDLVEVSAGGGSIAWVQGGSVLRVGPQSAGARPGPACYGLGGAEPTITDAHLATGRLRPDYFLGGRMLLDVDNCRAALERKAAGPLGMPVEECAAGILAIANAQMIRALKLVTVERGYDPSRFTLIAFGGAGPLHAAELAEEMNISRVLIPAIAGVTSALGLLAADYRHDFSRSFRRATQDVDAAELGGVFEDLERQARQALAQNGVAGNQMDFERALDMRYIGQAYEVTVRAPGGKFSAARLKQAERSFHREHQRLFAHSQPAAATEIVIARLSGLGRFSKLGFKCESIRASAKAAALGPNRIYFKGCGWVEAPVMHWSEWAAGQEFYGPALVIRDDSTLLVPFGWRARKDEWGSGILER